MSELLALIDEYKDQHGQPSDASIERGAGLGPKTIGNWRGRGVRQVPGGLQGLATFIGEPYEIVLRAALVDAGLLPQTESDIVLAARRRGQPDA